MFLISDSKYEILFLPKKFLRLFSSILFQFFTEWYKSWILKSYLLFKSSNKNIIFFANSTSFANNCLKAWSIFFGKLRIIFCESLEIFFFLENSLWSKLLNSGNDNTPS